MPENQEAGRPPGKLTYEKNDPLKEPESHRLLLNPAEIFSRLPKEEYFQRRNKYVAHWTPICENMLSQDSHFAYRDDTEITRTAATLFSRTLFIADYLREQQPYDKFISIKVLGSTQLTNNHIGGETWPFFYLKDEYVHRYFDVSPTDIKHLKLTEMQIYINMNKLGADVETENKFAKHLKQQSEPKAHVDTFHKERIEWLGIRQELGMVEEIAHAFYIMGAAQNPESLKRFLEEEKQYPKLDPTSIEPRTAEEMEETLNNPIEQDADKWVDAFTRHYYPEID